MLYLGSFSKVLAPGLRCGWIVAPKPLLERLEIAKQAADLCSGMLDQSIVDELVAGGELAPQIERVRAFYRGKRGMLIEELERHFTGRAHWTSADGGLFTFVTLNDDIDTAARVNRRRRERRRLHPRRPVLRRRQRPQHDAADVREGERRADPGRVARLARCSRAMKAEC